MPGPVQGGPTADVLAIKVLRAARSSAERMGSLGFRYVAVADWLEAQVPRLRSSWRDLARAAIHELTRPQRGGGGAQGTDADEDEAG
jgi:hypothetical protein